VNQLGLVQTVDGLGQRVVIAVAPAAHRGLYARLVQAFGVADADVLTAPVGMVRQDMGRWLAFVQSLLQGIEHEVRLHAATDAPAHDAPSVSAAPTGEETEYDIYPKGLPSPYKDRRQEIGELLYGQLKIPREDKVGRALWFARNFEFFGAPIGLFCSVDRLMGPPQWADLGMILQNVMLLLRAEGLDSCPQECWAIYPKTMGTFLCLPPERMLFAGMAIGYANADNPVNQLRTPRATFDEIASTMI
jgi:hypothetical protein